MQLMMYHCLMIPFLIAKFNAIKFNGKARVSTLCSPTDRKMKQKMISFIRNKMLLMLCQSSSFRSSHEVNFSTYVVNLLDHGNHEKVGAESDLYEAIH